MEFESVMPADLVEGVKYRMTFHSMYERVWDGVFVSRETTPNQRRRYVFEASTPQAFTIVSPSIFTGTILGVVSINKIVENTIIAKWKERTLGLVLKGLVDDNFECDYLKAPEKQGPIRVTCFMKTHDKRFLTLETTPNDPHVFGTIY